MSKSRAVDFSASWTPVIVAIFCMTLIAFVVSLMSFVTVIDPVVSTSSAHFGVYPAVKAASTESFSLTEGQRVIDGVDIEPGDRVLIKDEQDSRENGIYVLNETGVYERSLEMSQPDQIIPGNTVFVNEGELNGQATYMLFSAPVRSSSYFEAPSITGHGITFENANRIHLSLDKQTPSAGSLAIFDPHDPNLISWVDPPPKLPSIAAHSILANNSSRPEAPQDSIAMVDGGLLTKDVTRGLVCLPPGAPTQILQISPTDQSLVWGDLSDIGVTSITSLDHQIIVSASRGAVHLSLPQALSTSSSPVFNEVTVEELEVKTITGLTTLNSMSVGSRTLSQLTLLNTEALQLTSNPTAGWVMSSDADGFGHWTNLDTLSVTHLSGTTGQILTTANQGQITLSLPQDISTTSSPVFDSISGSLLTANQPFVTSLENVTNLNGIIVGVRSLTNLQNLVTSTFRLSNAPGTGFWLVSDSQGVGTWTNPETLAVTSLQGTSQQISVSASRGAVTLTLPQAIAMTSSPTFASITATLLTANQPYITHLDRVVLLNGITVGEGSLSNLTFVSTQGLQLTAAPTQGYVLTTDASGNGSWTNPATLAVTSLQGTPQQVNVSANQGVVTLSLPQSISTTSSPTFANLSATLLTASQPYVTTLANVTSLNGVVVGARTLSNLLSLTTEEFCLTTSSSSGFLLMSDVEGHGSWVDPTTFAVTSLEGTNEQVLVSASLGHVTLSLPQSISPTSSPTFNELTATLLTAVQPHITTLESVTSLNSITVGSRSLANLTSVVTSGLKLTTSPIAGYVLRTDTDGNGQWTNPASLAVTSLTGTSGHVLVSASQGAVILSLPQSVATTASPTFTNLSATLLTASQPNITQLAGVTNLHNIVVGSQSLSNLTTLSTLAFQLTQSPGVGFWLTSDATGNAGWTDPTTISVTSVSGTSQQINVSAQQGAVVLSLPQSISTSSDVQFHSTSVDNGTAAQPSVSFKNAPTSGMYLSAANQVSVAANGFEALRADSSGNITIPQNLIVNGTTFVVDSQTFSVADNIAVLATSNPADSLDIGLGFQYVSGGTTNYGVLYRASGTNDWLIKDGVTTSPGSSVMGGFLANLVVANLTGTLMTATQPNVITLENVTNLNSIDVGTRTLSNLVSLTTAGFKLTSGAGSGLVLQSDSLGNASWVALSSLGVTSLSGTTSQIVTSSNQGGITLSLPTTLIAPGTVTATTSLSAPRWLLTGTTSGTISILPQSIAGTYNFNLPTTAGSSGQLLTSGGGINAAMTWTSISTVAVSSLSGTLNQINVSNSVGNVTLSLPSTLTTPGSLTATTFLSAPQWLMTGSSSGTITILPQAASGTYNFNLPTAAGTSGQLLTSGGGSTSPMTWSSIQSIAVSALTGTTNQISASASVGNVTLSLPSTLIAPGTLSAVTSIATPWLMLNGATSGSISILSQPTAGTYNFNLPTTAGSAGQLLVSGGGVNAPMIWTNISSIAVSSLSGTTNQVNVSGNTGAVTLSLSNTLLAPGTLTAVTSVGAPLLLLSGSVSGTVSVTPQANAGTYAFNLPITAGSSGQLLTSAGGGLGNPMTWSSINSIAVSSLSGTSNQITVSNSTGAVTLTLANALIAPGTLTATTSLSAPRLFLTGATSGTISILPQAAAGTYNFNLPTSEGVSGQLLTSGGGISAPMTWTSIGSVAVSSLSGTTNQIVASASTGTVILSLSSTLTAPGTVTAVTSVSSPQVLLTGVTSGTISILPQASAGTYNFNLPTTAGTSGLLLTSGGGGSTPMTWTNIGSVAVSSLSGTTNQIVASANTGTVSLSLPSTVVAPGSLTATTLLSAPQVLLTGATSGTISILPQASAGTYNFNLPTTAGSSGFVLTSGGGGSAPMTWTNLAAFGVSSVNGTTNQITASTVSGVVTLSLPTTVNFPGDFYTPSTSKIGNTLLRTDSIEINNDGTGNRYAYIDFHADDTYTDFALRLIRENLGPNSLSSLIHRGVGILQLVTQDAADFVFKTNNLERVRIQSTGNVGIGLTNPTSALHQYNTLQNQQSSYVNTQIRYDALTTSATDIPFTHEVLNVYGKKDHVSGTSSTLTGLVGVKSTVENVWGNLSNAYSVAARLVTSLSYQTVSNFYAFSVSADATANSTVTNSFAFHASNPTGAGTFTNKYGCYIGDAYKNYFGSSVGIGITNPNYSLQIATSNASICVGTTATVSATDALIGALAFSNNGAAPQAGMEARINVGGANNNADLRFFTSLDYSNVYVERMRIDRGGNVGVGTSAPVGKLHAYGGKTTLQSYTFYNEAKYEYDALNVWALPYAGNQDGGMSVCAVNTGGYAPWAARFALKSDNLGQPRGAIDFVTRANATATAVTVECLSFDGGGKIGIGTTSPGAMLNLTTSSTGRSDAFFIDNDNNSAATDKGSTMFYRTRDSSNGRRNQVMLFAGTETTDCANSYYTISTVSSGAMAERVRIKSDGRVGIGTSSALNAMLTVKGSAWTVNNYKGLISLFSTDTLAANVGAGIIMGGVYTGTTTTTEFAQIAGVKENGTDGSYLGALSLSSRTSNGNMTEAMRITSSGSVGIGTASVDSGVASLQCANTSTVTNGGYAYGLLLNNTFNMTAGATGQCRALSVQPGFAAPDGKTINSTIGLYGSYTCNTNSTGVITSAYGVYIDPPARSGSGTITTAVGMRLYSPYIGQNNYGIILSGGDTAGATRGCRALFQFDGTVTGDDGGTGVVSYLGTVLSPTVNNRRVVGCNHAPYIQPYSTNTITEAIGHFQSLNGSRASGVVNTAITTQIWSPGNLAGYSIGLQLIGNDSAGAAYGSRYLQLMGGTLTGDDGGSCIGLLYNAAMSPTNNTRNTYGMYVAPYVQPYSTNTISNAYGTVSIVNGAVGSGAVGLAVSSQIYVPTLAASSNNYGMVISGNDANGATAGGRTAILLNGTLAGDDGDGCCGIRAQMGLYPGTNNRRARAIYIDSYFASKAGNTMYDGAGLDIYARFTSNLGTIVNFYGVRVQAGDVANGAGGLVTNAYGLYVNNPSIGATKNLCAYFEGNVGIGTSDLSQPTNNAGGYTGYGLLNTGKLKLSIADGSADLCHLALVGGQGGIITGSGSSTDTSHSIFLRRGYNGDSNVVDLVESWGKIRLWTGTAGTSTERFTVAGGGNVGVGNTSPDTRLHVNGTSISSLTTTTVQEVFKLSQPNTSGGSKGSHFSIGLSFPDNPGNNYPRTRVDFKTTGRTTDDTSTPVTVMSLTDSGCVGIGTVNPTHILTSNTYSGSLAPIAITGSAINGTSSTAGIAFVMTNNTSGNRQLAIGNSDLLGSNSTNPLIRIVPNGQTIDALATDLTPLPLTLGNNATRTTVNGSDIYVPNLLGIGKTPACTLDVNGSIAIYNTGSAFTAAGTLSNAIDFYSGLGLYRIGFDNADGSKGYIRHNIITGAATNTWGHVFSTSSDANTTTKNTFTNTLFVGASGCVGVGTVTPANTLQVTKQDTSSSFIGCTNNLSGHTINDGVIFGMGSDQLAYVWNRENTDMLFGTNNSEKMRITAAGNATFLNVPKYGSNTLTTSNTSTINANGVLSRTTAAATWNFIMGNFEEIAYCAAVPSNSTYNVVPTGMSRSNGTPGVAVNNGLAFWTTTNESNQWLQYQLNYNGISTMPIGFYMVEYSMETSSDNGRITVHISLNGGGTFSTLRNQIDMYSSSIQTLHFRDYFGVTSANGVIIRWTATAAGNAGTYYNRLGRIIVTKLS